MSNADNEAQVVTQYAAVVFAVLGLYPGMAYIIGTAGGRVDIAFTILKAAGIFHVAAFIAFLIGANAVRRSGQRLETATKTTFFAGLSVWLVLMGWVLFSILTR